MPRYGIAAWCLEAARGDTDVFAAAERHGLDAMHLGISTLDDVARLGGSVWRKEVEQRCRVTRVGVSCLALNIAEQMAICGAHSNALVRRQFRTIFLAALDFAAEASIPLIYVPSFGLSEIVSDDCLLQTAEVLERLAESAHPLRIEVASENTVSPPDASRLVDLVALDNFKILFDVFNPLRWGHSPMEMIASNFESFAAQIHVKDGWLPGYGNAALGSGEGDTVSILRELMRRGFDGIFVLENDYQNAHGFDVRTDVRTMRTICGSQHQSAIPAEASIDWRTT